MAPNPCMAISWSNSSSSSLESSGRTPAGVGADGNGGMRDELALGSTSVSPGSSRERRMARCTCASNSSSVRMGPK
eukprot:9481585-Pyramimonas_sp.AAC.1